LPPFPQCLALKKRKVLLLGAVTIIIVIISFNIRAWITTV
jgi:hypothetical protein